MTSDAWANLTDEQRRVLHAQVAAIVDPPASDNTGQQGRVTGSAADRSLIGPGHPYGDPGWCGCASCHDNCDHTSKENPMAAQPWRKKPVVVHAIQLTEDNGGEVAGWAGGTLRGGPSGGSKGGTVIIDTLEGRMVAEVGDYVIRGVKGEHYPCKPDIFEATYEPA